MASPGQEKEYGISVPDPAARAVVDEQDEPLDVDGKEKEYLEIGTKAPGTGGEKEQRTILQQTKSYATTNSGFSEPELAPVQKKWYKNLNPLKWGGIPPVPEERQVSREYNAPFLSLVYFQWMAPLMSVSNLQPRLCCKFH